MLSEILTIPPVVLTLMFWVAAVACIVSQFFILRAVWRVVPSETGSPSVPAPRRASEVFWAILPTVLMIGAFIGAYRLMHSPLSSEPATSRGAVEAPAIRT